MIYEFDVPHMNKCVKIPLPGQAGALTTSSDTKHVLSFSNNMEAVLSEKTFKSFKAFSLSELMEFQQLVQYVARYQPKEKQDITDSVVEAVNVIAANSIQTHASMRDADALGHHGENFKAYTYLQVMYMVMFREVFEGALAEMFFWDYAKKFAIKASGWRVSERASVYVCQDSTCPQNLLGKIYRAVFLELHQTVWRDSVQLVRACGVMLVSE